MAVTAAYGIGGSGNEEVASVGPRTALAGTSPASAKWRQR